MRWLRDNWIDALIFAVFAITVVGIVLFLTGVNPFKSRVMTTTPAVQTEPVRTEPQPEETAPAAEAPAAEEEEAPVTVVPLLPTPPESEEAARESEAPRPAAPAQPSSTSEPAAPATRTPAATPAPSDETGIFRVSVGAFSNPLNALSLAKELEAKGFSVRLEPVGRVTRVVVGPFNSRAEAERAAARLTGYEPRVYRGDTPPPEDRYLQVGAFKRLDSARATIAKLRESGDWPVVLSYRPPWLKVWVGPGDEAQIKTWKQKLKELGFDVVEVR